MRIKKIADKIAICAYCPFMCKDICSIYSQVKVDSLSPSMHEYLLWLILEGKMEYSEEVSEVLYQACSSCLLCQSWCATDQDVPEKIRAARADIVDLNLAPRPVVDLNQSTLEFHNPFQELHEKRFRNISKSCRDREAEILFFVGCTASYLQPKIANSVIKILKNAHVNFEINSDEWCCGLPQFELGLLKTAKNLAQHNSQLIKKNDYKMIITSCPECYYALKKVYPQLDSPLDVKIYHTSEYIRYLLKQNKIQIKNKLSGITTYHDPCYLGRYCNIYEDPRMILKHTSDNFIELRWNREKAYCGGSGVAYSTTYPKVAVKITDKVLEETVKIKAKNLITSCPKCKNEFLKNPISKKLNIYDLTEVVSRLS